jgi:hypothetical protein
MTGWKKRKVNLGAALTPSETIIGSHRIWERWRWGNDDEKPPILTGCERHLASMLPA